MNEKYKKVGRLRDMFEHMFGGDTYIYKEFFSQRPVIAKRIEIKELGGQIGVPQKMLNEISLQRELIHKNIWRFLEYVTDQERKVVYLVYEHFDDNLCTFMKGEKKDHLMIKKILYQVFCGLAYLHGIGLMHQQVRPENILVDLTAEKFKIADFRLVRLYDEPEGRKETNVCYRAPEVLLDMFHYITGSCDIWSVGCIFIEMVEGTPFIFGNNELDRACQMFKKLGTPKDEDDHEDDKSAKWNLICGFQMIPHFEPQNLREKLHNLHLEEAGIDLLLKMLCCEPSNRISAFDALQHDYFKELKNEELKNEELNDLSTSIAKFKLINADLGVKDEKEEDI